jgi:hypothetical protein
MTVTVAILSGTVGALVAAVVAIALDRRSRVDARYEILRKRRLELVDSFASHAEMLSSRLAYTMGMTSAIHEVSAMLDEVGEGRSWDGATVAKLRSLVFTGDDPIAAQQAEIADLVSSLNALTGPIELHFASKSTVPGLARKVSLLASLAAEAAAESLRALGVRDGQSNEAAELAAMASPLRDRANELSQELGPAIRSFMKEARRDLYSKHSRVDAPEDG